MNINNLINSNEAISCVPDNQVRKDGIVYMIYKVDNTNWFYIGSSFKSLAERVRAHRYHANESNSKFYNFVNQYGWHMFNAQVLEEVKFVTRGQLLKREGDYQLFYKPTLNSLIAGNYFDENGILLSKYEYRQRNKEHISEYRKQYRKNNIDYITQRKHEYYESNKDYINQKCKEYHESHREEISMQSKIYREEHKEEIKQRDHEY